MKRAGGWSLRSLALAAALLSLAVSCRPAPSRDDVDRCIRQHFLSRHYQVEALELGEIESVPLAEKRYMGTPGHHVQVKRIVLTALRETPDLRRGQQVTFRDAVISIRESTGPGGWIISGISGIPLP